MLVLRLESRPIPLEGVQVDVRSRGELEVLTSGRMSDFIGREVSLMDGGPDRYRMDDLYLLDLRAEKTFAATSDVNLTFGIDLFNVFNAGTVLSRETTLNSPLGDYVSDVVSPRIWKLGVRVSWR